MLTALHVSTVCLCLHWSMQRSTDKSYTIWYLALLVYDYVLTLGDEVELFWRRGPPVSRALMFCCRALVVMYVVTTIIATYIFPLYTTEAPSLCRETLSIALTILVITDGGASLPPIGVLFEAVTLRAFQV